MPIIFGKETPFVEKPEIGEPVNTDKLISRIIERSVEDHARANNEPVWSEADWRADEARKANKD